MVFPMVLGKLFLLTRTSLFFVLHNSPAKPFSLFLSLALSIFACSILGSLDFCVSNMETVSMRRSVFDRLGSHRVTKPSHSPIPQEPQKKREDRICKFWVSSKCLHRDRCRNRHSWFDGKGFSMLKRLEGHKLAVTGVALPSGSDKLYSCARDGTMMIWDCHSAECVKNVNLGDQVGCLISEGSWVFVGLPDVVKAWNVSAEVVGPFCLEGPVGQVYAMAVANGNMLFAGAQDGAILAWRGTSGVKAFELVATLDGHTMAVVCLTLRHKRLYSGSMDNTIRVWDVETLLCIHTLKGHTDVVKSLVCCDQYLLSCSLDKTIKVWADTEEGGMEVIYTHEEEYGVNAICGMCDAEAKPILLCSCKDNSVRLYELPSFKPRGKIFSNREVGVIQTGPAGLFFTGDGLGVLSVWQWLAEPNSGAS